MGRHCTVCSKPQAGEINRLLAEGRSARSVAAEFGVSHAALLRHDRRHVNGASTTKSKPRQSADDPLDELVDALRTQALAGNPAIVHQYRLALAAQLDVKHATPPKRDLADEQEWHELRSRMLTALAPYPDARLAIAVALDGIE